MNKNLKRMFRESTFNVATGDYFYVKVNGEPSIKGHFMAGTLAAINTACAKSGLNNLVVSTYSKDYLLVKKSQLKKVKAALGSLGFREST